MQHATAAYDITDEGAQKYLAAEIRGAQKCVTILYWQKLHAGHRNMFHVPAPSARATETASSAPAHAKVPEIAIYQAQRNHCARKGA